jgi:hypothetical protein
VLDLSIAGGTSRLWMPHDINPPQNWHPTHLTLWPYMGLLARPHHEPSADFMPVIIQASAPHSATYGGTASTSPASGNETSSTPDSRISEQRKLAFGELLEWGV